MATLNTRELQDRLEELESLKQYLEDAQEALNDYDFDGEGSEKELDDLKLAVESAQEDFGEDEQEELEALENLANSGIKGWHHGVILYEDLEDYTREVAQEHVNNLPDWLEIDWDATIQNLEHDFSIVEYNGEEYYFID